MTVRKDSDAVAALVVDNLEVWCAICQHNMKLITGPNTVHGWYECESGAHSVTVASPEGSSPTKTLKQVAQKIDDAHSEVYYIWNTFGDRFTPIQLNHLESALKLLSEVLAILTTSTDETDGKGGTE